MNFISFVIGYLIRRVPFICTNVTPTVHKRKRKTANVTPIFKNDDPALCNNYRPISLLSNISKIFAEIIHARLSVSVFLSTNNILYKKQFGFRNQHSTDHALIEITEITKQGCDSGKFVCGVFLNFQKAFDTVNHDILLKKLGHYGIQQIAQIIP